MPNTSAINRARQLLLSCLTPEQKQGFLRSHGFYVRGEHTGRLYLLGYGGSVSVFDDCYAYCIHLRNTYNTDRFTFFEVFPNEDHILAQKLMLENDEQSFLKIAAKTPSRITVGADRQLSFFEGTAAWR